MSATANNAENTVNVSTLLPYYLRVKDGHMLRVQTSTDMTDDSVQASLAALGITKVADSETEAVELVKDEIKFLWNSIACEEDDLLSPEAQALKETLRSYLEETGA